MTLSPSHLRIVLMVLLFALFRFHEWVAGDLTFPYIFIYTFGALHVMLYIDRRNLPSAHLDIDGHNIPIFLKETRQGKAWECKDGSPLLCTIQERWSLPYEVVRHEKHPNPRPVRGILYFQNQKIPVQLDSFVTSNGDEDGTVKAVFWHYYGVWESATLRGSMSFYVNSQSRTILPEIGRETL